MAGCVNRAQMLEALEVMTAVCERERIYEGWHAGDRSGPFPITQFGEADARAVRLLDAYRARWGQ